MKAAKSHPKYNYTVAGMVSFFAMVIGIAVILSFAETGKAGDPFKNQKGHAMEVDQQEGLAFDQVNWKRPQGVFSWITMARGYDTPWDSFGRQGWMTQDAYIEPIDPGVSEFAPETTEIYIVFEGQPLDAPGQFAAAWYLMADGKTLGEKPLGKDVIELEMNQRYGYFILRPPREKWEKGRYLVKVYYGSPGQELHDTNIVGTMEFSIKE